MEEPFEIRLRRLRQELGSDAETGGGPLKSCRLGSLRLSEVADVPPAAGAIFSSAFRTTIPSFPRHFVLFRQTTGQGEKVIGYVHYTHAGTLYLAGGLVVSAMQFRALDKETANRVRDEGGLAEWIVRTTCEWLEGSAIFAYMGDIISIRVNTRVGFQATPYPHLYVKWKDVITPEAKDALLLRIAAFGTF